MTWLLVMLPGFLAGLVQGLTGFGAAITMMIFLPSLLPMSQAAGVAGLIMCASVVTLVWKYHRYVHFKQIIVPFLIYASVAAWSVHLGKVLDVQLLRTLLGGLLVCLAIYFTVSKQAGTQRYPWFVAGIFMIISGFFNGLFGIGGPLMALYFLSLSTTTGEYIGNLQTFFLIDVVYITSVRVMNGIITPAVIPDVLIGMVGAIIGTMIAARLLPKLPMDTVRKGIYAFIGVSGLYYLFF
ncbi:sulfite exporter TauE/SafE family protein [Lactiplantibacillus fabifermentans]|uniref:Probable membrane transporter protein n=2 Tax=Lactiplantibacillus fabifermentans TaxID=483011 RepID=A0A0R2NG09_9LACO|nr:sulfite exporter TauE/SafE family protein [Lactiplantibacillus fabifermentans]ETY73179.1 sulfite export protein [Lactiplantibacillus fabifermentans T30PCM01]KRO23216.1 transport protein [Lactiplantibacillus fabifermentans DSM 21115]